MKNKKSKINPKSGLTLMLALLVVSVGLIISFTISSLVTSEIQFTILSRESQRAFFAADAGAECALYWDLKEFAFATDSPQAITCVSYSGSPPLRDKNFDGFDDTFNFSLSFNNGSCADVEVDKSDFPEIRIFSYGYNAGQIIGGACAPAGGRDRVERALRVRY